MKPNHKNPFRSLPAALLAILLAGLCALANADNHGGDKDIRIEPAQRPIAAIDNPGAEFKVSAWVNKESLTYAPGEEVVFTVQSNRDAYLTLLNIGTSGKVHIIFPNKHQQDNFVRAGQPVKVPAPGGPFSYRVSGPAGTEVVKVIATQSELNLAKGQEVRPAGPFKTFAKGAEALAKDIEVVLAEVPQNQWAEYTKVFKIVEAAVASSSTPPAGWQAGQAAANPGGAMLGAGAVQGQGAPAPGSAFRLHIAADKAAYKLGDTIRFAATASRDCSLTLVDIGTSGKVTMIFPNRYQQNNRLAAGQTVTIPPKGGGVAYKMTGAPGMETVMAICTTGDQALYPEGQDFDKAAFRSLGGEVGFGKDIEIVLQSGEAGSDYVIETLAFPLGR